MISSIGQDFKQKELAGYQRSHHLYGQSRTADLAAFNELVLTHQDTVYRQAFWLLGEEEAAEDATQEAFILAFRNLHAYNGGPFRPWILKITTNYCLDQLRKKKRRPTTPIDIYNEYDEEIDSPIWLTDPGDTPETAFDRADKERAILQSIHCLPVDFRSAITLVDLQDFNYQEAAALLQVPVGTLKSRLARGRMVLRKVLSGQAMLN